MAHTKWVARRLATVAEPGQVPRTLRLAGLVVVVEAMCALAAAIALGVLTAVDRPQSYGLAVAGTAFALATAAGLGKVAGALARAEGWAHAPAVVTQLLLLPVGWTLASTNGRPLFGTPLLVLAVVAMALLFSPAARSGLQGR